MKLNRSKNGGVDDYYTQPDFARQCALMITPIIRRDQFFVEPSAGDGAMLRALEWVGIQNYSVGYDIKPRADTIREKDWFDVLDIGDRAVVFGNPPFGFACSTAVRFFNHAAKLRAEIIAFILPRTFRKTSVVNRLDPQYERILDADAPKNAFLLPDTGEPYHIPACFQVWVRVPEGRSRSRVVLPLRSSNFDVVPHSEPWDFAVRRAGGKAGQLLDPERDSLTPSSTLFLKATGVEVAELHAALKAMEFRGKDNTAGVRSVSKREFTAAIDRLLRISPCSG
jgi:hypothetical protein